MTAAAERWWDAALDEVEGSIADAGRLLVGDAAVPDGPLPPSSPSPPWAPPATVPGRPSSAQLVRAAALLAALEERVAALAAARAATGAALAELGDRRAAGQAYRADGAGGQR